MWVSPSPPVGLGSVYLKKCWHFLQLETGLLITNSCQSWTDICTIAANRCFSKLNFFIITALWNNFTSGNWQDDFICFYVFCLVQTHFLLQVRLIGLRPLEWIQHNEIQIQPLNSWTDFDVHNYGGSHPIYLTFIGHIRDSFQHFSLQTRWLTASLSC